MTSGAIAPSSLTFTYQQSGASPPCQQVLIPHTGTFKLYLTEQGYDPTKPLTWSELPDRPFATVKDPALTSGAYRITADKEPTRRTRA